MPFLATILGLGIRQADRFDPDEDSADAAFAVPFAMNRDGSAQSLQGQLVVVTTARLVKTGRVRWAVASGGHKLDFGPTEATWATEKLVALGVPERQIVVENHSLNTRENIVFALESLKPLYSHLQSEDQLVGNQFRVVIVAQELQAKRALATFRKAARQFGIECSFKVLTVSLPVWKDNAKRTLRHPLIFALREIFVAWPLFKLKGWL